MTHNNPSRKQMFAFLKKQGIVISEKHAEKVYKAYLKALPSVKKYMKITKETHNE